jgi:hypothetical protein
MTTTDQRVKAIEDELKLIQCQVQAENDTGEQFVGLSLTETIYRTICLDQLELSNKLKSMFNVSEKR